MKLNNLGNVRVLKLSITRDTVFDNLPVTLEKIILEPCKCNIYATKEEGR